MKSWIDVVNAFGLERNRLTPTECLSIRSGCLTLWVTINGNARIEYLRGWHAAKSVLPWCVVWGDNTAANRCRVGVLVCIRVETASRSGMARPIHCSPNRLHHRLPKHLPAH